MLPPIWGAEGRAEQRLQSCPSIILRRLPDYVGPFVFFRSAIAGDDRDVLCKRREDEGMNAFSGARPEPPQADAITGEFVTEIRLRPWTPGHGIRARMARKLERASWIAP